MKPHIELRTSFELVLILIALAFNVDASDLVTESSATKPYLSVFAPSIDKLVAATEIVFESVDRPDLSRSMSNRLKSFRNFAGIDRTKPLGVMSLWDSVKRIEVVFLPVNDIDELLKTATFGIVGYREVSANHYEIERPQSPYHVLVRDQYAYFADDRPTIERLRIKPEQLTRGLRDRYDFVVYIDLRQIPRTAKTSFVDDLRSQIEPRLQPQDDEAKETANLRKTIGRLTLDLIQRIVLDTNSMTFGGHLDPKTRLLSVELVVEADKGSALEAGLNRMVSHRSEFNSLISPDAPAGVSLNLPLGGFVEQVLGKADGQKSKGSRLEAGLQLVGERMGEFSLIASLYGSEANDLNDLIPDLMIKLEKSGKFIAVCENFDSHEGVVLHSLVPREMPSTLTQIVGSDVEIIIGQGIKSIWIGLGNPETLPNQMKDTIDLVVDSPKTRGSKPLVRARFQAKQLPDLLASELLNATIDADSSRVAFAHGQDGFSVTIEPVPSGLKLRVEAEEGFIRLIGQDWIRQIDAPKQ